MYRADVKVVRYLIILIGKCQMSDLPYTAKHSRGNGVLPYSYVYDEYS